MRRGDVVEALDHPRVGHEGLEDLGRRGRLVLQLGHHAVTLRVVVHRVDHHPVGQRGVRQVAAGPEGHGHHDEVAGEGRLLRRRRPGVRTELVDEVRERLRSSAVAQHDVVAGPDRQPRDGAADVAAADEAPGGHAGANAVGGRRHSRWARHPRDLRRHACADGGRGRSVAIDPDPPTQGDSRDPVRLHPDDRAERPPRARRRRGARRGRRLRPARVQRPLLALAHRAGPRAVRLDGARCGRARDEPGGPDDLRDLPDDALPPRRRRAEGGDPADPGRGPLHPGARQRREPQRARRR